MDGCRVDPGSYPPGPPTDPDLWGAIGYGELEKPTCSKIVLFEGLEPGRLRLSSP